MVVSSSDNFVTRGFVQPPALPRNLFAQGAVQGTFLDLDLDSAPSSSLYCYVAVPAG